MVTFEESKMTFSFPEDDVYRIEKSPLLADVAVKVMNDKMALATHIIVESK